ncbi:uncharacterized protein LOC133779522 [Humulus lupulus]|uniref:uncharacterized protein LOC133779522 n=1 Tax=Humulus lupulus TaxID=3486 RepID=UPI002B414145|nr:uncharacterized protein LOC133779522 [Humulus lupulus]
MIHNFELQTKLQGVRDDVWHRIFPATLSEIGQQWFFKLQPVSITSWDEFVRPFYSQFSSAMPLPAKPNDLVAIKQRDNEPLKDYTQCFMREATRVKSLSDDGKIIAINSGVKVKSLFWSSLKRKFARTTQEFLDRAKEFIKLKEAKQKVDNPIQTATEQGKQMLGIPPTLQRDEGMGLRMENTVVVPYTRPPPMRKDVNRRDMTKFCRFHNDYGHETNECNHLKEEIEFLIRQNNAHLKRYVLLTTDQHHQQPPQQQSQQYQSNQPLLQPPAVDRLDMICSGPHLANNSGKARERYARSLKHGQEEVVLAVQERTPKQPRYEYEPITFS